MLVSQIPKNIIVACHITGVYDSNRKNILPDDDFSIVEDWVDSITSLNLNGIIFHNNFSKKTCLKHRNEHLSFVKVDYDNRFNPNTYRYIIYDEYLRKYGDGVENIFLTDISDVVIVQNPFLQPLYLHHTNTIFCGDEPKILNNEWMRAHSEHLRGKIENYAHYEAKFGDYALLNCGIVGGNIKIMRTFIEKLATIHRLYNADNQTEYTGDMGAFNYLIRTAFNDQFFHGTPINTVFKMYQNNRTDCWFRHK